MKSSPATQRLQKLLPRLFETKKQTGQRYLVFQITQDLNVAINLEKVWKVNHLPATAVTAIPQMPAWVLGWANGSDRVFCIIDLAEFLGFSRSSQMLRQYPLVVVQVPSPQSFQSRQPDKNILLGFSVNRIQGTIPIHSEQIVSPVGEFPEKIIPYLVGVIKHEQQQVAVLNPDQITQQMSKNVNSIK